MFLIQANGKSELFGNDIKDDFLQFLPDYFGCDPANIHAFYIDKVSARAIKAAAVDEGKRLSFPSLGSILVEAFVPGSPAVMNDDAVEPTPAVLNADGSVKTPADPGRPATVKTPSVADYWAALATYSGKALAAWPYDSEGNFLGNILAP